MKLQSEHDFSRAGGHQNFVKGRRFAVAKTLQEQSGLQPLIDYTLLALMAA